MTPSHRLFLPHRATGFTLLEVLVAVALVVVVSTLAFMGLDALVRARAQTDAFAHAWQQENRAWHLLRQDISYAIPRPLKNAQGTVQPPFVGQADGFRLTRYSAPGWPREAAQPINAVRWFQRNGQLIRSLKPQADARAETGQVQVMLSATDQRHHFEYLDAVGRWHRQWPPQDAALLAGGENAAGRQALPQAVRWRSIGQGQETVRVLYPLARPLPEFP